jgi:hypothetical protein
MTEDICEACGERNVADAQFCTSCGSYLGWDGASRPVRTNYPPTSPPTSPPARPDEPPTPNQPDFRTLSMPATGPLSTAAGPRPQVENACPSCGTMNSRQLRFCRKCGLPMAQNSARTATVEPEPKPVRRSGWISTDSASERAARAAYRRSLPMRFRFVRVGVALGVVAAVVGVITVTGRDPVGWTKHRLDDLRGTLVAAPNLTAAADPPDSVVAGYSAAKVVDHDLGTAWAISYTSAGSKSLVCGPQPATPALLITAATPVKLRAIEVRAGLAGDDPDRPLQWRPQTLELRSGGWCQRIVLADTPDPQRMSLKTVTTKTLRISVVGAFAPQAPDKKKPVAISEIQLLSRPR